MYKNRILLLALLVSCVFLLSGCAYNTGTFRPYPPERAAEHIYSARDAVTRQVLWVVSRSEESHYDNIAGEKVVKKRSPALSEGETTVLPKETTWFGLEVGVANPLNKRFSVVLYAYENGMENSQTQKVIFSGMRDEFTDVVTIPLSNVSPLEVWLVNDHTRLFVGPFSITIGRQK